MNNDPNDINEKDYPRPEDTPEPAAMAALPNICPRCQGDLTLGGCPCHKTERTGKGASNPVHRRHRLAALEAICGATIDPQQSAMPWVETGNPGDLVHAPRIAQALADAEAFGFEQASRVPSVKNEAVSPPNDGET